MPSSYLIPYRLIDGKYEVLILHKRILSLKGLTDFIRGKKDFWKQESIKTYLKTEQGIIELFNGIRSKKIGVRFNGIFLYAGGKPAFFGGKVERNETCEQAAIREFIEESGFKKSVSDKEIDAMSQNIVNIHNEGRQGFYYIINFDSLPVDIKSSISNLDSINSENEGFFLDFVKKYPHISSNMKDNLERYETKKLEWISIKSLDKAMNSAHVDMDSEVNSAFQIIHTLSQLKQNEICPQFYKTLKELINNQDVDWNVNAANEITVDLLQKIDCKGNSEVDLDIASLNFKSKQDLVTPNNSSSSSVRLSNSQSQPEKALSTGQSTNYKTPPCRFFKAGQPNSCRNGKRCTFAHG